MSIKHKLLLKYFSEDFIPEVARLTPLRRFLYTIGFDYKDLTREQIDKWARTKRYKDFVKMRKIKRMADEANVKESVIINNIDLFLSSNLSEEEFISESDKQEFLQILEYGIQKFHYHKKSLIGRRTGRRGHYKSASQRSQNIRRQVLNTINTGGTVSTGESDIRFRSGKKRNLVSGSGKVVLRKRLPNRPLSYKRSTLRTY